MINTKDLIKIKEYDRFVLFQDKNTGIRECILKIDLLKPESQKKKWER